MDRYKAENAELKKGFNALDNLLTLSHKNLNVTVEEIAELKKQLKILKRLLFKVNKELDLYKNRGYSSRKVRGNAIRNAAEVVAAKLQKENFPTVQALAMGRMYVELLAYADKQERGDDN